MPAVAPPSWFSLEVFRRLGKPALVLTPTLTIRDQWLLRLLDFLPPSSPGDLSTWTSTSMLEPSFLTVTTYQALLARHRADPSEETRENHRARGTGTGDDDADWRGSGVEASENGADDEATGVERAPSDEDLRSFLSIFREIGLGTLMPEICASV